MPPRSMPRPKVPPTSVDAIFGRYTGSGAGTPTQRPAPRQPIRPASALKSATKPRRSGEGVGTPKAARVTSAESAGVAKFTSEALMAGSLPSLDR